MQLLYVAEQLQFTAIPRVVSSARPMWSGSAELASHITHSSRFSFSLYCSVRLILAESFTAPSEIQPFYFWAKAWTCIPPLLFNPSCSYKQLQRTLPQNHQGLSPTNYSNAQTNPKNCLQYFWCTLYEFYLDFLQNNPHTQTTSFR